MHNTNITLIATGLFLLATQTRYAQPGIVWRPGEIETSGFHCMIA